MGDKVASHQQLAIRHNASLGTVKRAVQHLVSVGVLEGRQGSGVFVRRLPTEADQGPARTLPQRVDLLERQVAELMAEREQREP